MPRSLRIVLADDNPPLRFCVLDLLSPLGVDVTELDDGDQLQRLLAKAQFDLVITDVRMPGVQGVDVLRGRRAAGDCTPFVVMTGAPDELDDQLAGLSRVVVLGKPFTLEELHSAVDRAISSAA